MQMEEKLMNKQELLNQEQFMEVFQHQHVQDIHSLGGIQIVDLTIVFQK